MNPDIAQGRSLRSGFLANTAVAPERTALIVDRKAITYRELDAAARLLAAAILETTGRPVERVGVLTRRSIVGYLGPLAALYAGAAFVPLNPTFPPDRTAAMAQRARLDAIVVDSSSEPRVQHLASRLSPVPVFLFPDSHGTVRGTFPQRSLGTNHLTTLRPLRTLAPTLSDDLAYLLFTSGSTGAPKGVGVTHANVLHFLDALSRRLQLGPDDRFSQTFEQTFDLSVFDMFMAWEHGACVCAMQPIDVLGPTRYINENRITVWFSVPSAVALMRKKNLLRPNSFPSLRLSLFCGEPLPRKSAESWLEAAPKSLLENLYGPTELTIACFAHRWEPQRSPALCDNGIVPIGRPFEGLCALLVDDEQRPTHGPEGELWVAGPQTVPGYWLDVEKTMERFVDVAFSATRSKRFYKTGDRVRRLPGGEYVYLGRTDTQLKVLGFRVELAEIEAVLRDAGVVSAVALGWPMEDGRALGVVAFVVGDNVDPARLREDAARTLPSYMVPTEILVVDELPLNPNGKVDRRALAARLAEAERR